MTLDRNKLNTLFNEDNLEKEAKNHGKFVTNTTEDKLVYEHDSDYKEKLGLETTPHYKAYEVADDSLDFAFSSLIDKNNDDTANATKGLTIVSIGCNPGGDSQDKNASNDMDTSKLGPTRQNLIKKILFTLHNKKQMSQFVQVDLFARRTPSISDLIKAKTKDNNEEVNYLMNLLTKQDSKYKTNLEVIKYWIDNADWIILSWGSAIGTFLNQFQRGREYKQEILNYVEQKKQRDSSTKVFVLGIDKGEPVHPRMNNHISKLVPATFHQETNTYIDQQ